MEPTSYTKELIELTAGHIANLKDECEEVYMEDCRVIPRKGNFKGKFDARSISKSAKGKNRKLKSFRQKPRRNE